MTTAKPKSCMGSLCHAGAVVYQKQRRPHGIAWGLLLFELNCFDSAISLDQYDPCSSSAERHNENDCRKNPLVSLKFSVRAITVRDRECPRHLRFLPVGQ
jgi:hypothetical protein